VKHLLLLRHAEARPATPGTGDRERPLSAEGRLQAERVGEHLARRGLEPGLVLCSPARRAQETLAGVRRHLPEATRVRIDAELALAEIELDEIPWPEVSAGGGRLVSFTTPRDLV
jgi:phosphohistidine phosphatase